MKLPSILVVDDDVHAGLYEFWLPDRYTVETATSEREALSAIDRTIGVTVLRHEVPTETKTKIEGRLAASSPANKFLVTTSDHTPVVFPDVDADACLHEPIAEKQLVETVERLLKRALYHEALRRYYRCSMQRVNNRYERAADQKTDGDGSTDGEEVASDHSTHEETAGEDSTDSEGAASDDRAELDARMARLTAFLDELRAELDTDDVEAVLDSLRGGVTFENESSEKQPKPAKHRPDRCRSCGLVWGKEYGDRLGEGYSSLGAFTWRCRQCGEVQNIPSPKDRTVARWRA